MAPGSRLSALFPRWVEVAAPADIEVIVTTQARAETMIREGLIFITLYTLPECVPECNESPVLPGLALI